MKQSYVIFFIIIFLFTFTTFSSAKRYYSEPSDYAYFRGRFSEFMSIYDILGRKQFFNLVDTCNKKFGDVLVDRIIDGIEQYDLEQFKNHLPECGSLGIKFLNRIQKRNSPKAQLEFIRKSIRKGIKWYINDLKRMKKSEIFHEIMLFEKRLSIVPKIIVEKEIPDDLLQYSRSSIAFRQFNFDTTGFGKIFRHPMTYQLPRLVTLLVSPQYLSQGVASIILPALGYARFHSLLTDKYMDFLIIAIVSDINFINFQLD